MVFLWIFFFRKLWRFFFVLATAKGILTTIIVQYSIYLNIISQKWWILFCLMITFNSYCISVINYKKLSIVKLLMQCCCIIKTPKNIELIFYLFILNIEEWTQKYPKLYTNEDLNTKILITLPFISISNGFSNVCIFPENSGRCFFINY